MKLNKNNLSKHVIVVHPLVHRPPPSCTVRVVGGTDQVCVCGCLSLLHSKVLRGDVLGRLAVAHGRQQAGQQQSSEHRGGDHGGGRRVSAGGWRCREVAAGPLESSPSHPPPLIPTQSPARWDAAASPCLIVGCRSGCDSSQT